MQNNKPEEFDGDEGDDDNLEDFIVDDGTDYMDDGDDEADDYTPVDVTDKDGNVHRVHDLAPEIKPPKPSDQKAWAEFERMMEEKAKKAKQEREQALSARFRFYTRMTDAELEQSYQDANKQIAQSQRSSSSGQSQGQGQGPKKS